MNNSKAKILELKNITAGYDGKPIIEDVFFQVQDDDFIGIIGPNGGGKTTLLRVILNMLKPMSGKLIYNTKEKLHIGYLPQDSNTDTRFPIKVEEVIFSGLANTSKILKYNRENKQRVNDYLQLLELDSVRHHTIGELSGGQLQRTLLGRAIISQPRLLILDEPDTYMDNTHENKLYELLGQLNKSMAILIVSHNINACLKHVKTIACVNQSVHYHAARDFSFDLLEKYNCPIAGLSKGSVNT